jgi:homoserine dehydrogenase
METKKIHIVLFGIGNVGSTLIDQFQKANQQIAIQQDIHIEIIGISDSKKILLTDISREDNWRAAFEQSAQQYDLENVLHYVSLTRCDQLIAIDATASTDFVQNYDRFIAHGFHIISANKIANTLPYDFYNALRKTLKENKKQFLYETNVGAGLPIIDTIRNLHDSGENITRIRGVFSGSLSYIFNQFSQENISFSEVLKAAVEKGYTEPDPREDLSGNDVARKLLILARELDLENEFEDIAIENLIPIEKRAADKATFLNQLSDIDAQFQEIKEAQQKGHVLRYVGDLYGDLFQPKGNLKVSLESVPETSSLGSLKGTDALIEIFTESYGDQPMVIQGAGAGASVTARGVFGDILRLAKNHV